MKKTTYITTRFDVKDGFYVLVSPSVSEVNGENMYDFFLGLNGYGIESHMFGLYEKDCHPDIWEELIENNIDEYIRGFIADME